MAKLYLLVLIFILVICADHEVKDFGKNPKSKQFLSKGFRYNLDDDKGLFPNFLELCRTVNKEYAYKICMEYMGAINLQDACKQMLLLLGLDDHCNPLIGPLN